MFWTNSPFILFDLQAPLFPLATQTLDQQLNSLLRLTMLTTFVALFLTFSIAWLWLPLLVALATITTWETYRPRFPRDEVVASLIGGDPSQLANMAWTADHRLCQRPTPDNPLANLTPDQLTQAPNRPPACPYNHPGISDAQNTYIAPTRSERDTNMHHDLLTQPNHYLNLQFHTMPATTNPNDRTTFANWLYKPPNGVFKDGDADAAPINGYARSNLDLAEIWVQRGAPSPNSLPILVV